jgi:hypothetical protein
MFFASAVATWDADFYIKVDDDVHVNLGMHSLNFFIFVVILLHYYHYG